MVQIVPSCLKAADIAPIYKRKKKDLKDNCRPVSILPVLSKLYEKSIFLKKQCGFRKATAHNIAS